MSILPAGLKRFIMPLAKTITPNLYWHKKFNYLKRNFSEVELYLLPILCNREKTSIDIGASRGVYIVHMLDLSLNCIAFEPRADQASELKAMLATVTNKASVEPVGLSDKSGATTLKMLVKDPGRSTIEGSNTLDDDGGSERIDVTINIRKLDDYRLNKVGFIKIDVEGHELAVLNGATETIAKNLPALLIEIENRHKENAISDTTTFLKNFGYSGFFILDGKVTPIEKFDPSTHQDSKNIGNWTNGYQNKGVYINNFIFIPLMLLEKFIHDSANVVIS